MVPILSLFISSTFSTKSSKRFTDSELRTQDVGLKLMAGVLVLRTTVLSDGVIGGITDLTSKGNRGHVTSELRLRRSVN